MIPELAVLMIIGLSFYAYPMQIVLLVGLALTYKVAGFVKKVLKSIKDILTGSMDLDSTSDYMKLGSVLRQTKEDIIKGEKKLNPRYSKLTENNSTLLNDSLRLVVGDLGFMKTNIVALAVALCIKHIDYDKISKSEHYRNFVGSIRVSALLPIILKVVLGNHLNKRRADKRQEDFVDEPIEDLPKPEPINTPGKPVGTSCPNGVHGPIGVNGTNGVSGPIGPDGAPAAIGAVPIEFYLDESAEDVELDDEGHIIEDVIADNIIPGIVESDEDKVRRLRAEILRIRSQNNIPI